MRAIVKVSKNSAMAHLNGHTFIVKEVIYRNNSTPIFALNVNGNTTDFSAKEVIIIDLLAEFAINRYSLGTLEALKQYVKIHNIYNVN